MSIERPDYALFGLSKVKLSEYEKSTIGIVLSTQTAMTTAGSDGQSKPTGNIIVIRKEEPRTTRTKANASRPIHDQWSIYTLYKEARKTLCQNHSLHHSIQYQKL